MNDQNWKIFYLKDLFTIEKGTRLTIENRIPGNIPFVTAGHENQGVSSFIGNDDLKVFKNSITIDMFAEAFYRDYSFCCDDNIHVLTPKEEIDKYASLFIVTIINAGNKVWNYGKQYRLKTFERHKIMLPITEDGNPDYEYMKNYIKDAQNYKIKKYNEYIASRINELNHVDIEPLDSKKWEQFYIDELFNINSGKRLTKANMVPGNTPFIGASSSNNGITNYVGNTNGSFDFNVLGVNYNGSVVENFYHPYGCLFSDDVKRFHLKNYEDNKYVLLFFKAIILKQKEKYMYGYKFNEERMRQQLILVPVNNENKPDYKYMEQYMINKEIELLTSYMEYLNTNI